ncbi:MAG: carboxypeptidase regulatory-like domain-containing protein [Gemmatimonadaceae bacterium]
MALAPLLVCATLLGLAPHAAGAQVGGTTDIIIGTVTGPDGQPLAGARVEVTSIETEVTRSKATNDKGQYTILFPDGGGQYRVTVRFLGMAPQTVAVARQADEDRLVANVRMSPVATPLATVVVEGNRAPPRGDRPAPGSTERVFTGDQLQRLPIDPSDPNAIAALVPGVVSIAGSDSGAAGFSVAGQRPDQNRVTLDGLSFGAGAVPQEAVRTTRVITNTYDITRGQFTGGEIATTTRGGTNAVSGSFGYALRDPHLQWTDDDAAAAGSRPGAGGSVTGYTQHQLSGGVGGPLVKDKLFWFGALQLRRRLDPMQSLLDVGPATLAAFGANPDSAARFLAVVEGYGLPLTPPGLPDERTNDNASLMMRLDYHLTGDHSLTLRGNWQGSLQEGVRVTQLGVPHHGGEQSGSGGGVMLTLSSVLGSLLNEFRGGYSRNARDGDPYLAGPEGRTFISSDIGAGGTGVSSFDFGGNSALPTRSGNGDLELSDELSWLSGGGGHRWKLGALLSRADFDRSAGTNLNGTFVFNSLADLEANRPSSFTRSLTSGERASRSFTGAVYFGDVWRLGQALQVTYGLRAEGSSYRDRPEYNPDIERLFGRRTDEFPTDMRVTPRLGFTWMVGSASAGGTPPGAERGGEVRGGPIPGGGGRMPGGVGRGGEGGPGRVGAVGAGAGPSFIIRGGIGEFRGRAPTQLFSSALDATGLPSGETHLTCTGDAVPAPDWAAYLTDPSTIPTRCADGGTGTPQGGLAALLPNVTVFDPDFAVPRSWRASLGVSRRLSQRLALTVEGSFAIGVSLYGVRDLNLDATPRFTLAEEGGRPVYVPAGSIVPTTGATSLAASRRVPEYANVLEVYSGLESRTAQLTLSLGGMAFRSLLWNASYTWMRSRDQSSSTSGFGGGSSAFGAFGDPATGANPNDLPWATSDFERRHSFTGSTTWLVKPWLDVTSVFRVSSGTPYTPRVSGDINGDGARNDQAFVFDPLAAGDSAVANGMTRLLNAAPDAARACLQSQLGGVAGRNSCRSGWSASLDLQANVRPYLGPTLQRRVQFLITLANPLTGLDQLLHGSDDLRGWGQPSAADPTLLHVRGFDPAEQRYIYTVNERFGSNGAARAGIRNPFQIGFQVRVQVGPDRQRELLQAMLRSGRAGASGGGLDLRAIVERVAPDPVAPMLERADSLGLAEAQIAALRSIADSLRVKNDSLAASLLEQVGQELRRGGDFASIFPKIQPRLQEARNNYVAAVRSAERVLTPEQWQRLPEEIRNPTLRRGPGAGGRERPGARPPG